MRSLLKNISLLLLFVACFSISFASAAPSPTPKEEVLTPAKLLSSRFGEAVTATGATRPTQNYSDENTRANFLISDHARRTYRTADGNTFTVEAVQTRTNSAAYALLTAAAEQMRQANGSVNPLDGIGTYAVANGNRTVFFRDTYFVNIEATGDNPDASSIAQAARAFDSALAQAAIDADDIPVLVKHLPDWQQAQQRANYAVSLAGLQNIVGQQQLLHGYDFSGGSEAVVAPYTSPSGAPVQLVIVEHFTPQLAADNDRFLAARANELRASGAPVPAYRRIGNYLVFAFDAPDEAAANALIGQVKYEQDVRWLGDNPFAQQRAERAYTMMTLNVLLGSLKSAGLGILLCLGVGATLGSIVFMRRRAQSAAAATYSDAGGMVRLGIDDLTAPRDTTRLLASDKK